MLEQQIQKKIINRLEAEGWFVLKIIRANKNGYPELFATKDVEFMFIEVKRPEGTLSELQKARIKELRSRNINVKIWHDYEQEFKE